MSKPRPVAGMLRFLAGLKATSWAVWTVFIACLLPEAYFGGAELHLWGSSHSRDLAIDFFGFWAGLWGNWRPNYAAQPYLMFVTYGFLHAGLVHFAVNMLTLFSLGTPIAALIGAWRFLAVYMVLIGAGAVGFLLAPEIDAPMIGASGALFGLAGLLLGWDLQYRRVHKLPFMPVVRSVAYLVGLNVVLWWAMQGQLAWQTHLGGFLAGWLISYRMAAVGRG